MTESNLPEHNDGLSGPWRPTTSDTPRFKKNKDLALNNLNQNHKNENEDYDMDLDDSEQQEEVSHEHNDSLSYKPVQNKYAFHSKGGGRAIDKRGQNG